MRGDQVESVFAFSPQTLLPIRLEQSASRTSPILMIAVLAPIATALLLPFAMLAEHLAADPAVRAIVAERPQSAVLLVLALAFCGTLFGWPLARFILSIGRARSIVIGKSAVDVTERGFLGTSDWTEPLAAYAGISHTVRASLSGLRHELMLVHRDPSRSVLLAVAPRIAQQDIDAIANLLNLAEIPSREASSLRLAGGLIGPAEPQPRLDTARA
jgi:hypothetical protein